MVRDDFSWQLHNHTLTFGGTFKFIKTNSNLINDFNFPGIGLQGTAFSGMASAQQSAPPTSTPTKLRSTITTAIFATGLGVIGTIAHQLQLRQQGQLLWPQAPAHPRALSLLPD